MWSPLLRKIILKLKIRKPKILLQAGPSVTGHAHKADHTYPA